MTSPTLTHMLPPPVSVWVHLWSHVAQVEGVLHGFLTPLVIGCSGQVTSVEATPPVVSVGCPVKHVHAVGERGQSVTN